MKQTPFHSRKVILATFGGAVNLLKKHLSSLHQTLNQVSWDALGMGQICQVHNSRAGHLRNVKIQSFYGSWEKRDFVKTAVSRTVRLRECPLGELPLYFVKQNFPFHLTSDMLARQCSRCFSSLVYFSFVVVGHTKVELRTIKRRR